MTINVNASVFIEDETNEYIHWEMAYERWTWLRLLWTRCISLLRKIVIDVGAVRVRLLCDDVDVVRCTNIDALNSIDNSIDDNDDDDDGLLVDALRSGARKTVENN